MLIKGQVPNKEPVVSIGLVLPEDQIQVLSIQDIKNNLSLEIDLQTENIILPASLYKLPSIRAGRGFHWEKQISITVEGELEIKVVDDCLFLINHIPLEKYLMCVATSEMSGECPPALLESQTVAARSWLLAAAEQKHTNLGIDACNDDCCQRYQGMGNLTDAAISAIEETQGIVLIHNEKICDTRYSNPVAEFQKIMRTFGTMNLNHIFVQYWMAMMQASQILSLIQTWKNGFLKFKIVFVDQIISKKITLKNIWGMWISPVPIFDGMFHSLNPN